MEADASDAKSPESDETVAAGAAAESAATPDPSQSEKAPADSSIIHYFERPSSRDLYPLPPLLGRAEYASAAAAAATTTPRSSRARGVAAAIGLLLTGLGALAVYDHDRQTSLLAHKDQESQTLASAVASLKSRLDDIEAARSKDETADFRKLIGEVRTAAAASRDIGASVTQLNARVDHIEKDQGARFDKLADRVDQSTTAKLADIAARLDKIEKKTSAPVVAVAAPAPPAVAPALPPKPPATPGKMDPGVSNETTGSIDKPKPVLRNFVVEDVRDGVALIDTVDGTRTAAAGDMIPGAGRVQRIERRPRGWAVLTTNGVILSEAPPY